MLPEPALAAPASVTLADLLAEAEGFGLGRPQVLLAARHYCGVQALDELTEAQRADLLDRMRERYATSGDSAATQEAPEVTVSKRKKAA